MISMLPIKVSSRTVLKTWHTCIEKEKGDLRLIVCLQINGRKFVGYCVVRSKTWKRVMISVNWKMQREKTIQMLLIGY